MNDLPTDVGPPAIDAGFDAFIARVERPLRRALVARYGVEIGNDCCRDALAYAWERWDEVTRAKNPVGMLYRVGQSSARRYFRWRRPIRLPAETTTASPWSEPEPGLPAALDRLTDAQRVAVVLVHCYHYSYDEAAQVLDVPVSTVRNHIHRGLAQLRRSLEG